MCYDDPIKVAIMAEQSGDSWDGGVEKPNLKEGEVLIRMCLCVLWSTMSVWSVFFLCVSRKKKKTEKTILAEFTVFLLPVVF